MARPSFEELSVGTTAARSYAFTAERVQAFAALVDDQAAVHRDPEFARGQGFDGLIVHGCFVQAVISGMLGMEVPGERSVINSLSMKMHRPVIVDQTVDYLIEITALTSAVGAVSLNITASVAGTVVMSGKALCSFPARATA